MHPMKMFTSALGTVQENLLLLFKDFLSICKVCSWLSLTCFAQCESFEKDLCFAVVSVSHVWK